MTATEQIINDAIEGGWNPHNLKQWTLEMVMANYYHQPTYLLDPTFWQAVGKTRGWRHPESRSHHITASDMQTSMQTYNGEWMQTWSDFLQWLADGLTVEEALAKLTT